MGIFSVMLDVDTIFFVLPFHSLKFFLFISFFEKIFLILKVMYSCYRTFIK